MGALLNKFLVEELVTKGQQLSQLSPQDLIGLPPGEVDLSREILIDQFKAVFQQAKNPFVVPSEPDLSEQLRRDVAPQQVQGLLPTTVSDGAQGTGAPFPIADIKPPPGGFTPAPEKQKPGGFTPAGERQTLEGFTPKPERPPTEGFPISEQREKTLFSKQDDLGFTSGAEEKLGERLQDVSSPEQVKAIVGELKKEEVEAIGLEGFTEGKKKIKKEDVLDFVEQNKVKLGEEVLGSPESNTVRQIGNDFFVVDAQGNPISPPQSSVANAAFLGKSNKQIREPKFSDVTLPGGKNYQETLITLPVEKPFGEFTVKRLANNEISLVNKFNAEVFRGTEAQFKNSDLAAGIRQNQATFRSSHFGEPNVLVHIRHNDRIDSQDGKKVFFVEEIQSDWHQKGREDGYRSKPRTFEDLSKEMADVRVPDAPFKKSWPELGFKRALRKAIDSGADKIAWTTGDQQADRYDLSKHIDKVLYIPDFHGEGQGKLVALKGEDQVLNKTARPEEIEKFVGKEVSKKLQGGDLMSTRLSNIFVNAKVAEGVDLKIGGEGMRKFYDDRMVRIANKLGKKFGAKTETANIESSKEEPDSGREFFTNIRVHAMKITSQMAAAILKNGLPIAQIGSPVPQVEASAGTLN